MRCKTCNAITKHRYAGPGLQRCEVCGTERKAQKYHGDFPELTWEENEVIHEARARGYASCYPAYPDAESQARSTFEGARRWLETHPEFDEAP